MIWLAGYAVAVAAAMWVDSPDEPPLSRAAMSAVAPVAFPFVAAYWLAVSLCER